MQRVRDWRESPRQGTTPRRRRWQLIAGVLAFYLVRDIILHLALPAVVPLQTR